MIDPNVFGAVLALALLLVAFTWQLYANSLAIQCWFLNLRWALEKWPDRAALAVARAMPSWLIYWCTVVAGAHATTGKWGHEETPGVLFMDVLKRWGDKK